MPSLSSIDPNWALPFVCLIAAFLIVLPFYSSPYMNGVAAPAFDREQFPYKAVARATLGLFMLFLGVFGSFVLHWLTLVWISRPWLYLACCRYRADASALPESRTGANHLEGGAAPLTPDVVAHSRDPSIWG